MRICGSLAVRGVSVILAERVCVSYFGFDRVSGVHLVLARICDSFGVSVGGVI